MTSIITVLNKVYKEGLEPFGFQKIKSKYPCFVRVVAGEIIQVISYRKSPGCVSIRNGNCWYDHPELGKFEVFCGIATIYRREIDLSVKPINNHNWLHTEQYLYIEKYRGNWDREFCDSLDSYTYQLDSNDSMYETATHSLNMIKKVIIPIFDEVTDLESCVKYMEKYATVCMNLSDDERYGWDDVHFGYNDMNESLLYIKTHNQDDFKEQAKRACESQYQLCISDITGLTLDDYEPYCIETEKWRIKKVQIRDRILNTPEIYKNAVAEMERRKNKNIETLRSYGLNL